MGMNRFLRVRINVDGAIITLRRIRPMLEKTITDLAMKAALEVQADMQIPGNPITYPVHWASRKQQMAFFASNGFGGGIPYKRTGGYARGWKVVPVEYGIRVGHPWLGARFLSGDAYGSGQSSIHQGRWPKFVDAVNRAVARFKGLVAIAINDGMNVLYQTQDDKNDTNTGS